MSKDEQVQECSADGGIQRQRPQRHVLVEQVEQLCRLFDHNLRIAEDQQSRINGWQSVSAPPPREEDVCVSPENGPDYRPEQFRGGVAVIENKGGCLIFHFVNGGELHVSNPVVYVSPEKH